MVKIGTLILIHFFDKSEKQRKLVAQVRQRSGFKMKKEVKILRAKSVESLLRRIIESGNVPTNPCCYSTAFAKGQLCDLARDKTGATGEHTGRRLRELTEEGILEVQYRREHAFYRLKEAVPQLFQ